MQHLSPIASHQSPAFGSYVGNGNADGTFVYTGFRPAFLMIKNTTGGSSWVIFDNKRNPSNPKEDALFPNLSSAEYSGTNTGINFLSNGFKLKLHRRNKFNW